MRAVFSHIGNAEPAMNSAEKQFARLGFGSEPEPACWKVARLDGPVIRETGADPADSRALMRWRVLLSRNPGMSPYRISRIER